MDSTQQMEQLRAQFISQSGEDAFRSGWESILSLSPELFAASLNIASVPRKKSNLSPKDQALISLAINSAATHLYSPGIRADITAALKEGASFYEVLEVVEIASAIGVHTVTAGVPILVEVLKEDGKFDEYVKKEYDEEQEKLKVNFTKIRGYWNPIWEDVLRLDPEFFQAYIQLSGVPWMKEFLYCAFDAATTHLYLPGLKVYMRNALGYGATPQEILEVLEIATLQGLHGPHQAMPIIAELTSGQS
ncbi:Fc.00g079820.m01.CDS01 [Cosmosporella sp. VM-42]